MTVVFLGVEDFGLPDVLRRVNETGDPEFLETMAPRIERRGDLAFPRESAHSAGQPQRSHHEYLRSLLQFRREFHTDRVLTASSS